MLRFLGVLLLALAAVSIANGKEYRDPRGRFVVTTPEGWETHTPEDPQLIALLIIGTLPGDGGLKGFCLIGISETPQTKSKTQAEVNSLLDGQITPEFWKVLTRSTGETTTINSSGSRDKDGRQVYFAVYTTEKVENGKTIAVKGKDEVQAIPGSLHFVLCVTDAENYEIASPDFEIIFNSYEPKAGELIAQQTPPSVLTMFANVSYDGVARVLAHDTPDMSAAGWPGRAGSLVVDGAEPWEVCEGVNFTGKCVKVETSLAATATQNFSVGSVRRLSGSSGIAGALGTAIRRAMREAQAERTRRH